MEHLDEQQNEGLVPKQSEENTSAASESRIKNILDGNDKPEILYKDRVRLAIGGDKELNAQNAFNTMGISDEKLRSQILESYVWQSFGDLDTNFNCTMQLVRIDVQEKYKPEIDGETAVENVFKYVEKMDQNEKSKIEPSYDNISNQGTENNTDDISFKSRIDLTELSNGIALIKGEIGKVIVGQKEMIDMLIASILANGHSLIEGVPGVAKTISAKLLAKSLEIDFSRIQFTPDLMPSDILGTSVFNIKTSEFEFKEGPIFSNMILIDEINRAPAKTQAALFEVMEERQITIDGHKFKMDLPFIVLATQNPVEQEGTYRLPEAQLDRFLFKIDIDYPNLDEEIEILNREQNLKGNEKTDQITAHLSKAQISKFQNLVEQILIESHLLKYIADIIVSTRSNPFLYLGASPRASIAILRASKAFAAMSGRDFVTPEDIKRAAIPVLQHRVIVTPEREMEGVTTKQIIKQIIEAVEIPR